MGHFLFLLLVIVKNFPSAQMMLNTTVTSLHHQRNTVVPRSERALNSFLTNFRPDGSHNSLQTKHRVCLLVEQSPFENSIHTEIHQSQIRWVAHPVLCWNKSARDGFEILLGQLWRVSGSKVLVGANFVFLPRVQSREILLEQWFQAVLDIVGIVNICRRPAGTAYPCCSS